MAGTFRFSFGPWNIHEGADSFGPMVRESIDFSKKLDMYKKLGFDGVQFHDDDAVPKMNNMSGSQIAAAAKEMNLPAASRGVSKVQGLKSFSCLALCRVFFPCWATYSKIAFLVPLSPTVPT